jgi:hypothetical protein
VAVLNNLSPLTLTYALPAAYPSHVPPVACLHAPWLSAGDAAAIMRRLVALWAEMPLMMAGGSVEPCEPCVDDAASRAASLGCGMPAALLATGELTRVAGAASGSGCGCVDRNTSCECHSRHLCDSVRFPSPARSCAGGKADPVVNKAGAVVEVGSSSASAPVGAPASSTDARAAAGCLSSDGAHGHWGFESIILPGYACPHCTTTARAGAGESEGTGDAPSDGGTSQAPSARTGRPGSLAHCVDASGGLGGGGGAVCLFTWYEWLRNECVPWLLQRARALQADAIATGGAAKACTSFAPVPDAVGAAGATAPVESDSATDGSGASRLAPLPPDAVEALLAAAASAAPESSCAGGGCSGSDGGRGGREPAAAVRGAVGASSLAPAKPKTGPKSATAPAVAASRAERTHWLPSASFLPKRFCSAPGLMHGGAVWCLLRPCGSAAAGVPGEAAGSEALAAAAPRWLPSSCEARIEIATCADPSAAAAACERRCLLQTLTHDEQEEKR